MCFLKRAHEILTQRCDGYFVGSYSYGAHQHADYIFTSSLFLEICHENRHFLRELNRVSRNTVLNMLPRYTALVL